MTEDKFLHWPYQELNPGRPGHSTIIILTELPWIFIIITANQNCALENVTGIILLNETSDHSKAGVTSRKKCTQ
jgi:hypothetical protein